MPRPLHQRGFRITGDLENGYLVDYQINNKGIEEIVISNLSKNRFVSLNVSDGFVIGYFMRTSQVMASVIDRSDFSDGYFFSSVELPVDLTSENLNQVKDLYARAMELLDVEKRLKKYVPEFSTPSELSVYNLLEIENVQGLKLKGIKNAN